MGQTLRLEVVLADDKVGELLGVGHAPYPVVAFYQPVLLPHDGVGDLFGGVEFILDDLEHGAKARQHEYRHHHAPHPRRDHEALFALGHLLVQRAEKFGFAVFEKANGGVQLALGLVGHKLF